MHFSHAHAEHESYASFSDRSCAFCVNLGSNHYTKMINLTDETGAKVFESLQISLVCDACLKTEHPEKCTHKVRIEYTMSLHRLCSPRVFALAFTDERDSQVDFVEEG